MWLYYNGESIPYALIHLIRARYYLNFALLHDNKTYFCNMSQMVDVSG